MNLLVFYFCLLIHKSFLLPLIINNENMTLFLSTNDRTLLFVSPIFIIDSTKQIELLSDFETSEINIPIVKKQITNEIQTKLLEQLPIKLQNKRKYTIKSLPLNYVQLKWKNRILFFDDYILYPNWQEKHFNNDNNNLFITINCKTMKKCYNIFSRIRQDINMIMKNIRLIYTVNLDIYQPIITTINSENQFINKIIPEIEDDLCDDDDEEEEEEILEQENCDENMDESEEIISKTTISSSMKPQSTRNVRKQPDVVSRSSSTSKSTTVQVNEDHNDSNWDEYYDDEYDFESSPKKPTVKINNYNSKATSTIASRNHRKSSF